MKSPFEGTPSPEEYLRGLGYGEPGGGKSRLFTSFPDSWGKVVHLQVDRHARGSIMAKYRHNVIDEPVPLGNPRDALYHCTRTDWSKVYPGTGVVVLDTLTVLAKAMLQHFANKGEVQASHRSMASPAGALNFADKADYGAVQSHIDNALSFIYDKPYHFFVLCHAGTYTYEEGEKEIMAGGPLTVGRASIGSLAGQFNPTLFLQHKVLGEKVTYTVHTQKKGIWPAKVASPLGKNPMPSFEVPADNPDQFWVEFEKHYMKKEAKSVA